VKTYATVSSGIVTNVIVAEADHPVEALALMLPDEELLIESTPETGLPFVGGRYSAELEKFEPFKEFDSWTWNEQLFEWVAPVERPTDGRIYAWDEQGQRWFDPLDELPTE